jgi:anti-anti-sigma factor
MSSSPKSSRTRPPESAAGPPPDDGPGPTLRIGVAPAGPTHRVTLSGDLDAGSVDVVVATVERLLRRDRPVVVVVDHLTSCDVVAVGALVALRHRALDRGACVDLVGARPGLHHVLTLLRVGEVLLRPPRGTAAPVAPATPVSPGSAPGGG